MDSSKLQTASTYINNLLLARGLLRNGTPIEFANLASAADKHSTADAKTHSRTSTTAAAEIINLVHDLILRRDRDQDHTESLAHTLHTLRSDSTAQTSQISRLKSQNADLTRQLSLSQSAARAAQTAAHTADAAARTLREEVARVKTVLAQVRTQCANDVRKRDVQIQKLKGHLEARQRGGNKSGAVGASITIVPGATGRALGGNAGSGGSEGSRAPSLEDTEYSLRQESTEFLTQLSQGLSDENDALISLVRATLGTLKELQGLPHNRMEGLRKGSHVASRGGRGASEDAGEEMVQSVAVSYQSLSVDLEGVLGSLTDLLTNPSFAPVEEVHIREEEIQRLKEGWEKMESRWTEAVVMMQGWQKRMLSGGDTVNLAELKMGLVLGEGLNSPSRRLMSPSQGGNGLEAVNSGDVEEANDSNVSFQEQGEPNADDLLEFDEYLNEVEAPLFADKAEERPDTRDRQHQPVPRSLHLQDRDVNATATSGTARTEEDLKRENAVASPRKRYVEPSEDSSPLPTKPTVSDPTTRSSLSKQAAPAPHAQAPVASRPTATKPSTMPRPRKNQITKPTTSNLRNTTTAASPRPATAREVAAAHPVQQAQQKVRKQRPVEPALTVEEKLHLASREADARRLQSSSPCARPESNQKRTANREQMGRPTEPDAVCAEEQADKSGRRVEKDDEDGKDAEMAPVVDLRKRKRVGLGVGLGRTRRRKSTLSPDELQELMGAG